MDLNMDLLGRWLDFCRRLGVKENENYHTKLFIQLVYYYNQPNRRYHDLGHIRKMLNKFDEIKHLLNNPDAVELAIWFHDAIYETWANDNEIRSADLASYFIRELLGLARELANKTCYLIERTQYFSHDDMWKPRTPDSKYFVDIDLWVGLGGDYQEFQINKSLTALEYEWREKANPEGFKKRRLEIFLILYKRAPFYLTRYFRERYEMKTKGNLEFAIKELEEELFGPRMAKTAD